MYGGTDDEGEPLYCTILKGSRLVEIERKSHANGKAVPVVVDSGASGQYFDDLIIPDL